MKEIARDVPGDKVKLVKNAPPIPTNVKIVYRNNGQLMHIIFQYKNERHDGKEILEWIRQYAEAVTGRPLPPKETLVFDGEFLIEGQTHHVFNEEFKFEDRKLSVFNMMLKNAEFHDIDGVDSEYVLDMEMSYEYFRWDL
jgi:hypothetical protein